MKVEIETTRDGSWLKYMIHHAWRTLNISELNANDIECIIKSLGKHKLKLGAKDDKVRRIKSNV